MRPIQVDKKFTTYTIKSVSKDKRGYVISFTEGTSFFMPDVGVVPKVGQKAKLYGRGLGHVVRGLSVNGKTIFYRTEDEQQKRFLKEQTKSNAKKKKTYEANAGKYNLRVLALPAPFSERIMAFRSRGGSKWSVDFEPYELFVCEQAVAINSRIKTQEEMDAFRELDFAEQKKLVPALDDDHSSNTFGAACFLSRMFQERPDLVPMAHGALCPLVGCKEYGCYASTVKESHEEVHN